MDLNPSRYREGVDAGAQPCKVSSARIVGRKSPSRKRKQMRWRCYHGGEIRIVAPIHAFSRRRFIAHGSCFGAFYGVAKLIRLPDLAEATAMDSRVSQTPIVDKGFASVRKVGDGLYATISDPSKGFTTISNGGFLVGKDAVLLIEGFASAPGASLQMDALRMVSQVPVKAALDTHYHYD